MKNLETERLLLRPFKETDLDDFYEYCSMKTVGPNAGWLVHTNKVFSLEIIHGFIHKGDVLALFHKTDKKVIGSVGLHKKVDNEEIKIYEIGYVLSTDYEGLGIMTEAVKRVIKHAFIDLAIDKLIVCHFIENIKSQRVIEKCGFKYTHSAEYKTIDFGLKQSKYYSLNREDYIQMEGNK